MIKKHQSSMTDITQWHTYPELLALHGNIQPQAYTLDTHECMIGRSSICQIVIRHSNVSRLHARIEVEGIRCKLTDLESTNGTFVNGKRIYEAQVLVDRDVIGFGNASGSLGFSDPDPTSVLPEQLQYNERLMQFFLGSQPLQLTPSQFRLLTYLYHHAGQICTREECACAVWGRTYEPGADADALDRVVSGLRAQLRQIDPTIDFIQTRRKLGYILTVL